MHVLFAPATALMGRLRYAWKFVVVGLVLLVPLVFVAAAYSGLQRDRIAFSAKERDGVAYMLPLLELTARAVEMRHEMVARGPLDQDGLHAAISAVDAVDARHGATLETTARWTPLRAELLAAVQESRPASAFARWNAVADGLRALFVHVGDLSNLTLDPDLDTCYLMDTLQFRMPVAIDVAGRMGDRLVLARRHLGEDATVAAVELGLDAGLLVSTQRAVGTGLATATRVTASTVLPELAGPRFAALDREAQVLLAAVTAASQEGAGALDLHGGDVYRELGTQLARDVAAELDRLLATRIAGFAADARQVELIAAATALIAVYLFIGFYLSVATPVRRLVDVLRRVQDGALSARVDVGTRDELNYVGRALNDTLATTEAATLRLSHQAAHDLLTGLPNRAFVLELLTAALGRRKEHGRDVAVLFVDLDHFKVVNDSMGHDAGDALLRGVAERLRSVVRAGDVVARLAGDEFVLVCSEIADPLEAGVVADRVLAELDRPLLIPAGGGARREVNVGASVGIAIADGTLHEAEELVRHADMAMYRAKQHGRGRWELYDDSLRDDVRRHLDTREDLRRALQTGTDLRVHYQPILHLASGRVPLMEALVRWEHPQRGLLPPAEFVPLAEDAGLIVPLGAWVLEASCRQAMAWHEELGERGPGVAVNLSQHQLVDANMVARVGDALAGTGLPPGKLWLEITESAVMRDPDAAVATLERIRELGVRLSIDDFGTGYSSLAHLRRLPVDALKIDRGFVAGVGTDLQDEAIVRLVGGLASTLGLSVIAEGIETPAQLAAVTRLGCEYAQGYLLGRPQPPELAIAAVRGAALPA